MDFTVEEVEAWKERMRAAPPATADDHTVLRDGRHLDTPEKVLAWYVEIGAMTSTEAEEFLAHR